MRTAPLLPAALLLLLAAPQAWAQVKVDPQALDALTPHTTRVPQPVKPHPARPEPAHPSTGTTVRTGPATPLPPVPAAPPPTIDLPPPITVPTRPVPAPVAPPVSADAPGTATPIPGGLRITFGPGRADLNPATEAGVQSLVHGGRGIAPAAADASFTVTSFAAGTPEDPSTARRLSLSRAIGVRSVLIAQGIASVRIFVRALGPASAGFTDGPPDRVDVTVGPPLLTEPTK